jgi:tetratricopeptide (TPR) repeat protein
MRLSAESIPFRPMHTMPVERKIFVFLMTAALGTIHCAPKRAFVPQPVTDWDLVERMGLEAPDSLTAPEKAAFDRGWQSLRNGRLEAAASDIEPLLRRYERNPEVATAVGFLDLRLGKPKDAERKFQAALREEPELGPAQSGYFLVALQQGNEERAFERLLRLEESFPQHDLVDRYGATLRVNVAEARLGSARELMREQKYDQASREYLRALEVAPQAGALYLEAAEAELEAGYPERAVVHAGRAAELEPTNADAHRMLGEACYRNEDIAGAARALAAASALRPEDEELRSRLETVERSLRETTLPEEYLGIRDSARLTREQLAALLYVDLRRAFDAAVSKNSVIATDVAESWASSYILRTVGVGVLDVFPNHTFQPSAFVSRLELATALSRTLENLSPEEFETARASSGTPEFADLARQNPGYDAAALSVGLGLLATGDGSAFEPRRIVTGQEAASAVAALRAHMKD